MKKRKRKKRKPTENRQNMKNPTEKENPNHMGHGPLAPARVRVLIRPVVGREIGIGPVGCLFSLFSSAGPS
jgi:hypothetical protein